MSNKKQLEMILGGKACEYPPHFELLFFLDKELLGIDRNELNLNCSDCEFMSEKDFEVKSCLVERFGWAAVYGSSLYRYVDNFKQIEKLKLRLGHNALVYDYNPVGVFWMPTGSEIMDFVVMLYEQPAKMHEIARQKLKDGKELAKKQYDAGVDFIIQNTDFGFNSGPFVSPSQFGEFVAPYMTELVSFIHDMGLPVIMHSDGNLTDILDIIYNTGIDGYQSVDPQGNMDIKKVRSDFPDWILMGNVNCSMLQDMDEQRIRESVRYAMSYGGIGKRFIFSTSNCVYEGMPLKSYEIMLDEYRNIIAGLQTI